jgi:alpha-L-fucosidase
VGELLTPPFTSRDVRFTTKGGKLYAIVMKAPASGKVEIESLGRDKGLSKGGITAVRLLGSSTNVGFVQKPRALAVTLPREDRGDFALALEMTGAV